MSPAPRNAVLLEIVDVVGQRCAVIEGGEPGEAEVRLSAAVDVVEGAVLGEGQTVGAGDAEVGAVGGGQGQHRAASAAGGAAQQHDLAGVLEHVRHEVSAGEAVRGDQAEEILACQAQILIVKLAVEVHVYLIETRGDRAVHGVLHRDGALAEEGRDDEDRHVRAAAAVVGEIQHHVLNGASVAHDLRVGVEHDADGVRDVRGGGVGVIIRALRSLIKAVEGDVGGVADLLVDGRAVGIERGAGFGKGVAGEGALHGVADTDLLNQLDKALLIRAAEGQGGAVDEVAVAVVQVNVDHLVKGLVRGIGVGAFQRRVAARLFAQQIEALNAVYFL